MTDAQALDYLDTYLREELGGRRHARIRLLPPSGTRRSIDLVQDYDPAASTIHNRRGAIVTTRTREYFFPLEWVKERRYTEVHELSRKVLEELGG